MHAIDSPEILSSFDQGVQRLHIHRPEKKNALTRAMYRSLAAALHRADSDPAVRAILLHGEPDCFTSGNDVNDFLDAEDHTAERPAVQFLKAIAHARKPLVAAVNGLAVGIGTTLLLHCDLVYAAEEAWLQLPFTRLGLCPEAGASHLVPLLMGHQRAAELLLLGERFAAAKARDYGLVNEILPTDQVLPHALEKARALAALPAEAVQTSKHLLKRTQQSTIDDIMTLELVNFSRLLRNPEATAIMQAFLQRRRD